MNGRKKKGTWLFEEIHQYSAVFVRHPYYAKKKI